jgi:hypothetical protein
MHYDPIPNLPYGDEKQRLDMQTPLRMTMFENAKVQPQDYGSIREHIGPMCATAQGMKHITEMGVGTGQSTIAWLYTQPDKLVCYDYALQPSFLMHYAIRGRTEMVFHLADTKKVEIEPTDLLFIDTCHTYDQLRVELALHGNKAKHYIVMHDTQTFAHSGEDRGPKGLWDAIAEWLPSNPHWQVNARFTNNNGLTILGRA